MSIFGASSPIDICSHLNCLGKSKVSALIKLEFDHDLAVATLVKHKGAAEETAAE